MLELGQGNAAAADLIKDVNEADFMTEVVDASNEVPVIVDFWAPWCGPCKTLGPALEAEVTAARGAVKMVKVNVDQNQQIAAQMRIQSIPTVYAFYKGQPVDGFQGALPGSEIKRFIEGLAKMAGNSADGGLGEAVEAANEMLDNGDIDDAIQTYEAILEEDPANAGALGGLIRAHVLKGDLDEAEAILNGIPADLHGKPEIEAGHAQLQLARQAADAGPIADLRAKVDADPNDMQARLDLATALHAGGQVTEAVDELLAAFRLDREWNDGAVKTQLFTIFDSLPANDPIVLNGRRKLSSMIFA